MAASEKSLQEDWKTRYFKALNESDEQERRHGETLGRLQRDLRGLLEQFRGRDGTLDRALDAPSGRSGDDDAALVELLAAARRASLAGEGAGATELPREPVETAPSAALGALVDDLVLPAPHDVLGGEWRVRLDAAADEGETLAIATEIARTVSDILAGDSAAGTPDEARDTLQALLDQLTFPPDAASELATLTTTLQSAADGEALRTSARQIADFVAGFIGRLHSEIADLNGFLVQIKQRLDELASHVDSERSDRERAAVARDELGVSVRQSLADMRDEVGASEDINTLKQAIQAQIAQLDGNVSRFLETEHSRSGEMERRQHELMQKLQRMQRESETLRKRLAEAHANATHDRLTGLPNRHAYDERLRVECARMARAGTPLSLAVLDLDRFKTINDSWGHQAGDRVLKHLARELKSRIRDQDFFGRYGGEEFVLLLPDTALAGARTLADALREHIAGCRFRYKDEPVNVTISCGIAEFAPGEDAATVFERADAGLYAAKRNGRNRCEAVDA